MQLSFPYFWQSSGHGQTVWRALVARQRLPYRRERIATPDDDFLDLDWLSTPGGAASDTPLLVFCHGLEGDSQSSYIPLTVEALRRHHNWPVLAWNYRSCSGQLNRQPRFYNLGDTADLETVLAHANAQGYRRLVLVGFSAGGSIVVNFLAKRAAQALALGVVAAAAISAPMDLAGGATMLERPGSLFYNRRFCHSLAAKVQAKAAHMGSAFPIEVAGLERVQTLRRFDDWVTAPLHGYASAADYYSQCSGLGLLPQVPVPLLLWNARNDPFLSEACFPPQALSGTWPQVHGIYPARGGHCGFAMASGSALLEATTPGGHWHRALFR